MAPLLEGISQYERGFLTRVQLADEKRSRYVSTAARRAAVSDLRWATVESIRAGPKLELADLLEHAPLLGLRSLHGLNLRSLLGLARRREPLALVELDIAATVPSTSHEWDELDTVAPVLPALTRMSCRLDRAGLHGVPPVVFFASVLVNCLSSLTTSTRSDPRWARFDAWIRRMVEAECCVPELVVLGTFYTVRIHQPDPGAFELELDIEDLRSSRVQALLAILTELPRAHVRCLKLTCGEIPEQRLGEFEDALRGLPVVSG